jgi:predicted ATPase
MEFTCMPEISRTLTREAQQNGIEQLFLKKPLLFSELLLEGRISQFKDADKNAGSTVFFDRGLPDIHAYLDFLGTSYPKIFIEKCLEHRYSKVFMLPPWKEIYKTDNERYESFEESLIIFDHLLMAYEEMNYKIHTVPEGSVHQRVSFILNSL